MEGSTTIPMEKKLKIINEGWNNGVLIFLLAYSFFDPIISFSQEFSSFQAKHFMQI